MIDMKYFTVKEFLHPPQSFDAHSKEVLFIQKGAF